MSQAASSHRPRALEQWVRAKLIDRSAFPTRPTPAGARFRAIAVGPLNRIADSKVEIGDAPLRNHVRKAVRAGDDELPEW